VKRHSLARPVGDYISFAAKLLGTCVSHQDYQQLRVLRSSCSEDTTELLASFERKHSTDANLLAGLDDWRQRTCLFKALLRRLSTSGVLKLNDLYTLTGPTLTSTLSKQDKAHVDLRKLIINVEIFIALIYRHQKVTMMSLGDLAHEVALFVTPPLTAAQAARLGLQKAMKYMNDIEHLSALIAPRLKARIDYWLPES
jgi:hypothetical protein